MLRYKIHLMTIETRLMPKGIHMSLVDTGAFLVPPPPFRLQTCFLIEARTAVMDCVEEGGHP